MFGSTWTTSDLWVFMDIYLFILPFI